MVLPLHHSQIYQLSRARESHHIAGNSVQRLRCNSRTKGNFQRYVAAISCLEFFSPGDEVETVGGEFDALNGIVFSA